MKHIITILCFVLLNIADTQNVQAQTKDETEQWINDKMDKLVKQDIEVGFNDGVVKFFVHNFSLKDGFISIDYRRIDGSSTDEVKATNTPINLLNRVKLDDSVIKNHLFNMWFDYYYINKLNILNNDERVSRISYGIYNIEENLAERLVTAFEHYKTFYPTPEKKKEAF